MIVKGKYTYCNNNMNFPETGVYLFHVLYTSRILCLTRILFSGLRSKNQNRRAHNLMARDQKKRVVVTFRKFLSDYGRQVALRANRNWRPANGSEFSFRVCGKIMDDGTYFFRIS